MSVQPDEASCLPEEWEGGCPGPERTKGCRRYDPTITPTSVQLFPVPTGVLEESNVKDRPAVEKAKTLYRSCMNESEWDHPCQAPVSSSTTLHAEHRVGLSIMPGT